MKVISYRGGVVEFRIPSHWREEYSDTEGGTFYEDHPDAGTLRLKIITISTDRDMDADSGEEILTVVADGLVKGVKSHRVCRKDGNAALRYEESASERGTKLKIIYWVIANPLPPHHARLATFSYTVLASKRENEGVWQDLQMLEEEISHATFAGSLGNVSS